MNKREKAVRRAKNAIIAYLVASEQPKDEDVAIDSMHDWEALTYDKLLDAMQYNLKHNAYTNAALTNHMHRCIAEAARVETTKKPAKQLVEVC